MEKKYTIGQMAKICNISPKMLRYYDEKDILRPAIRNQETNYRYYSHDQIASLLLLQELRELKMPVEKIKKLLKGRALSPLEEELWNQLELLRAEEERIREKYDQAQELLKRVSQGKIIFSQRDVENPIEENTIRTVFFHGRHVLFTRKIDEIHANTLFISRRADLINMAREYGYKTIGANKAMFHSDYMLQFNPEGRKVPIDLETFIEIKNPDSRECIREIPTFEAVSGIFIGPYSRLEVFYQKLLAYAARHEIPLREGVSIEEYMVGATMTENPENYVTRVYLPTADAPAL